MTSARIYKPPKSAMQSGAARSKLWLLEFEPDRPREIEPLMGWTSSSDTRQQVRLRFDSKEEAIAYAERAGHRVPRGGAEGAERARRCPTPTISSSTAWGRGRIEPTRRLSRRPSHGPVAQPDRATAF